MINKELKLGQMKCKELADWFGISPSSLSAHKQDKLEELKAYADYEDLGRRGVNIIKIIEPVYSKISSESKAKIFEVFDANWGKNGLDTATNVRDKIKYRYKDLIPVSDDTAYRYVLSARNRYYGKPFRDLGEYGNCIYVWAKQEVDIDNSEVYYTPLTEEEEEIKQQMMKQYFGTDEEKDIMIAEMVDAGEITKEEAYDLIVEYRGLNKVGYGRFIKDLGDKIGATVTKVTLIQKKIPVGDVEGAFYLDEGNG